MKEESQNEMEQMANEIAYSMPPEQNAKLAEVFLYSLFFTCLARARKRKDGTWTERHEGAYEILRQISDSLGINIHVEGGEE